MLLSARRQAAIPRPHGQGLAISVRDVSKAYQEQVVLRCVSLDVATGELVSLLGPSGSGKTTLLQIIAGLTQPDAGSVLIDGQTVATHHVSVPPEKRALGVVFQDYALWPHMTVWDHVAFPLQVRGVAAAQIGERVSDLLGRVELGHLGARHPDQLSGGQQQRVAIARALACSSSALLVDEPLSNLDSQLRAQMRDELADVCRQAGMACVYVTHDRTEALAISDRIVVLGHGSILQDDAPETIFRCPSSAAVARIVGAGEIITGRVAGDGFWPDGVGMAWQARGLDLATPSPEGGLNPSEPPLDAEAPPVLTRAAPQPGDDAVLVVPFTRLHLTAKPLFSNAVQVEVRRSTYQGDVWEARCALPGGQIVRAMSEVRADSGAVLWCSFDPEHAYVTRKDSL